MKKAKIVKKTQNQEINNINDEYSIKTLLLIILIIVLVFTIFYFITSLVVKSSQKVNNKNNTVTEIDSSLITLNHLLDRSTEEYYVLATMGSLYDNFDSKINYMELYDKYINKYNTNEDSLPIYKVDLDDALNKNYVSDKLNISNTLDELSLNDEVLFKINDGRIEKYYVGSEKIIEALSSL